MKTTLQNNAEEIGYHNFVSNKGIDSLQILHRMVRNRIAFTNPTRSAKWKKWVREHPCCLCGGRPTDAHHIFGSSGSLKSSDIFTVPLCREHHNNIDTDPRRYELIYYWVIMVTPLITEDVLK
jgi:hypothetical protein